MAHWHFFQGVRGEWRWYRVDDMGEVTREAAHGFADLERCMADARDCGFRRRAFAVHTRSKLALFPRRRPPEARAVERRRGGLKANGRSAGAASAKPPEANRRRRAD